MRRFSPLTPKDITLKVGLFPSKYNVSAIQNGFTLHSRSIILSPDHHYYNISKPEIAGVSGHVYFDKNKDNKYTSREEIGNVNIDLSYTKLDGQKMLVKSITTDSTGAYSFAALVPGSYTLNATKRSSIAVGYFDYATQQTIALTANQTLSNNLSIKFSPITVSGTTRYQGTNVGQIPITFAPDASIVNNTAIRTTTTSDINGAYSAKLMPGKYNVTVQKSNGLTPVYSFSGQITILMGEGIKTYPIELVKHSVTVSGTTTYNGVNKANITIGFSERFDIANNTAIDQSALSTITGYTVELAPGFYNVTIEELVNESGHNVTYTFTGQLTVLPTDTVKTFNIVLTRVETP